MATSGFAAFPFVEIARPSLGGERTDACPGNGTATSQEAYQDSQRHRYQTLATTTTLCVCLSLSGFRVYGSGVRMDGVESGYPFSEF